MASASQQRPPIAMAAAVMLLSVVAPGSQAFATASIWTHHRANHAPRGISLAVATRFVGLVRAAELLHL